MSRDYVIRICISLGPFLMACACVMPQSIAASLCAFGGASATANALRLIYEVQIESQKQPEAAPAEPADQV
ncbi:MAG: hypothetical protein ACI93T_000971 [Porticoccaceae bacterium]|jgi:hypothetical protein